MLASTRRNRRKRRGIVLVLVLGLLGLMAVIGVTFATFSGQARVSARNFFQSTIQPDSDNLMDYALAQLICDTGNPQSALRGHSMARDMYGNDAYTNGYLAMRPDGAYMAPNNDPFFYITKVTPVAGTQYLLTTNIPSNDSTFYGYNFTRWTIRVSYQALGVAGVVDQTLEVLADSLFLATGTGYRTLTVNIGPTEGNSILLPPVTTIPPAPAPGPPPPTALHNYTLGTTTSLPGTGLINGTVPCRFILDGRWLRAFNGPGMTTSAVYGNFRFNWIAPNGTSNGMSPDAVGMDEDYDAADFENWFLAMQSADGSVIIPSFHRPAAIRIDGTGATIPTPVYDWGGPRNAAYEQAAAQDPLLSNWANSASRILRPRAADGHDAATFPDLLPDSTGKITYDVDNDGDGVTDSVWLDLGYPAKRNAQGLLYKPLFAFMVIGLNGRIPLNTAGNLAGSVGGINPGAFSYGQGPAHATHLGNSVSEIDPTYALQNGLDTNYAGDLAGAFSFPPTSPAANTQVDNAGIDVRITQLRNLLAGTRPPQKTSFGSYTNGDTNFVAAESSPGSGTGNPLFMPNGVADPNDTVFGADANGNPVVLNQVPPVAGRWGEQGSIPGGIYAPSLGNPPAINGYVNLVRTNYANPVRAGYSYDISDILNNPVDPLTGMAYPRDAADDNYNAFDPYPIGHNGELGDLDSYDFVGALNLPVDRMRRFVTPADINGTGSVGAWTQSAVGTAAGADPLGRVRFHSYYRPPGSPGSVTPGSPSGSALASGATAGAIYYPTTATSNNYFYTNGPDNNYPGPTPAALATPAYLPDVTNNPLHAFEFFRLPPIIDPNHTPGVGVHVPTPVTGYTFQFLRGARSGGAMPMSPFGSPPTNLNAFNFPTAYPTYNQTTNSQQATDGLNDADETNLYVLNPQVDSLFGFSDLEWLYRK
ncbi:MAG: hypothetical protein ACP5XB_22060, partial [Isosphaeraceae bacterium]